VSKSDVEVRDPLHVFIRLLPKERAALNSRPMQRLRFIHQLSMSYWRRTGGSSIRSA